MSLFHHETLLKRTKETKQARRAIRTKKESLPLFALLAFFDFGFKSAIKTFVRICGK
jgi:hypothetical protein